VPEELNPVQQADMPEPEFAEWYDSPGPEISAEPPRIPSPTLSLSPLLGGDAVLKTHNEPQSAPYQLGPSEMDTTIPRKPLRKPQARLRPSPQSSQQQQDKEWPQKAYGDEKVGGLQTRSSTHNTLLEHLRQSCMK
jgi:hypothetical protein